MHITYCEKQLKRMIQKKQLSAIADFIHEEDRAHIIQKAHELMNKTFTFDKTWDMERCIIPYHFEEIDWNAQRNDDEEWCFMLNRMDYLSYLILAGVLSGEKRYYYMAKDLVLDWIAKHEVLQEEPSTRSLDTGIRIMNIMEMLPYLYASACIQQVELQAIIASISSQIHYLKKAYLTKYTLSNWGSIQICAILSCMPLYDENYEKSEIFRWAKEELNTQFAIQVYEDGMQWEQSTMYHIEVLNYGMKVLYYHQFYKLSLPEVVNKQVKKLCNALFYQVTPNWQIETFGDSDRVCIRDVFTRAASLFENGLWKYIGYPVYDVESLYSFGASYAFLYEGLAIEKPTQVTYDGEDSGMFTMRSSWDHMANFTMFTNGPLGSGHGHSDNLHVSIYRCGIPILIDTGRLTYREDHPLRVALKRMSAHNTLILDEKECSLPSDSWGYHDFGIPMKNYIRHVDGLHYAEGAYLGHDPLQVWVRKLIVLDCGIWLLMDEVKADGNHSMQSFFHADPKIAVTAHDKAYQLSSSDKKIEMKLVSDGISKVETTPCSLRYNECLDHSRITFTKEFVKETTSFTYLCDRHVQVEEAAILQNGDTAVAKELAEAYKFNISEQESYTVAIFHKEIFKGKKIFYCEGMPFHAKCVVVHERDGVKKLIRLRA